MIQRTRPVFVDVTGRRRRLVTAAGALLGLGLMAGIAVLVVSVVTGSAPLPLPGLPASGQGLQQEQTAPAEEPAPSASARVPSGTPTITPAASAPPAAPPASTVSPATGSSTRGNRPTANPGNPKSSRTK